MENEDLHVDGMTVWITQQDCDENVCSPLVLNEIWPCIQSSNTWQCPNALKHAY